MRPNYFLSSRNGEALSQSSKYSFVSDGWSHTLVIKGASAEDLGQYECVAENVKAATELELEGLEEAIEIDQM